MGAFASERCSVAVAAMSSASVADSSEVSTFDESVLGRHFLRCRRYAAEIDGCRGAFKQDKRSRAAITSVMVWNRSSVFLATIFSKACCNGFGNARTVIAKWTGSDAHGEPATWPSACRPHKAGFGRQEIMQRDAQTVDVAAGVGCFRAESLLGRHVVDRAHHGARFRSVSA